MPKSAERNENGLKIPVLGVGIGLRSTHYRHILDERPAVPWFEVISENFMGLRGQASDTMVEYGHGTVKTLHGAGRPGEILDQIRRDYPIMLHGVSLNIGSTDPLRLDYLKRLKELADHYQPVWVSDHLCWTGVQGENLHDLLPLPFNEATLQHVVSRVKQVQDLLGRRMLLENVSSYLTYEHSDMSEWEFVAELSRHADCGILLDVNNIHVSATNHGFNPSDYIQGIPQGRVCQMHLAGYSEEHGMLIDTHDHPVTNPVWELYEEAVRRFGDVPALIEWDDQIPPLDVLQAEARKAEKIREKVLTRPLYASQPLAR